MVDWYVKHRKKRLFNDNARFTTLLDCITGYPGGSPKRLPSAIGPDVPKYKKGSHQRRLSNVVINNVWDKYKDEKVNPLDYSDFDTYVDYVNSLKVYGFGDTCIYDFCLNSGYKHGLRPVKKVYIHTGPLESLKALKLLGLTDACVKQGRVDMETLPAEIQSLGAEYAEDFLCVFHTHLTKMAHKSTNLK